MPRNTGMRRDIWLLALLLPIMALSPHRSGADTLPDTHGDGKSAVRQGIRIELQVEPVATADGAPASVREGEYADIRLKMSDAATGAPVTAMVPRAWIDLRKEYKGMKESPLSCTDKVRTYLQGTLAFRPDIDLNSYYILTLNNDATIAVIDPILGVAGYSQLYTMILLKRPGEDWTFSRNERTLYVTMPRAGQVAEIDTASLKVTRNIDAGSMPTRIAFQPDGKYLWIGNDATEKGRSGVTVVDPAAGKSAAFIPTGAGHHEIAFSDDSAYAFVTNRDAGTVSVIDVQRLKPVRELRVGEKPVSIVYSALSKALYVVSEGDGSFVVVDGRRLEILSQRRIGAGLRELRFAPGERWGFVINARTGQVHVFDASTNEVAYTEDVGPNPQHISFSREFAYVRAMGTAEVTMLPLAGLGKGTSLASLKISGGSKPPAEAALAPSPALPIIPTPEGNAVLIASPADSTVVYYMEGMGVPMGSFKTYGRLPRAVGVINRQLRETAPGVYGARVRVPQSGRYDVAFLLDSPRIVQCFEFSAETNPVLSRLKAERPVSLEFVGKERRLKPGEEVRLRFRLTDSATAEPLEQVRDLAVVASLMPTGGWQERYLGRPVGDGVYEITFRAPQAGIYSLNFAIPSMKVKLHQLPGLMLHAEEAGAGR